MQSINYQQKGFALMHHLQGIQQVFKIIQGQKKKV